MNKTWKDTIVEIPGTIMTDENGKFKFTKKQFDKTVKFTTSIKVADDTPWKQLAREATFIFVDGLDQTDVNALEQLVAAGEVTAKTRFLFVGHLVRTPGKPGMNDLYNLKKMKILPAVDGKRYTVKLDEALTKEEWQVIYKEKNGRIATTSAPVAPTAPMAPTAPF